MKKKVFLMGEVHELDFAKPAVFEQAMRKILTTKFKLEVAFKVFTNPTKKAVSFLWPICVKDEYKHEKDNDPDIIRDEYVDIITGGHSLVYFPRDPNYYFFMERDEFYSLYRDLCKNYKASKFKHIELRKQPDVGVELLLTF